jgi:hypothetical protein
MNRKLWIASLATIVAAASVYAQDPARTQLHVRRSATVAAAGPGEPSMVAFAPQAATFEFIAAEGGFGAAAVKGAPYTGEGVTEFRQTLADGTLIQRRNSMKFARDSEGRTRQEHTLGSLGPWAPAGEAPTMISINDPVEGVTYLINDKEQTVRKLKPFMTKVDVAKAEGGAAAGGNGQVMRWKMKDNEKNVVTDEVEIGVGGAFDAVLPRVAPAGSAIAMGGPGPGRRVRSFGFARNGKQESLGKQTVEGVVCDGTREIYTIAAGEVGNDRPIETVTERWYSPDLRAIVLSRTKDPMAGDIVYRLTNIRRTEPDKSLFQIPAGYTVKEGEGELQFDKVVK